MVQGNEAKEIVQVVQSQQKKQGKGKGRWGQKKKGSRGGQFKGKCFNCGGDHPLRDYKVWKEMRQKLCSSGN